MFINTFDYKAKGFVDKGADALLSSARYLFRGKNVTVVLRSARGNEDNPLAYEYVHQEPGNRSWLKVALAVVTLIPSLLLGGVVKLGVWACSSRFREVYTDYHRSTPEEANKEIKRIHLVMHEVDYDPESEKILDTINLFKRHLTKRFPEAELTHEETHKPPCSNEDPVPKSQLPEGTPIFMLNRVGKVGAGLTFGPDGTYGSRKCNHDKYPYTVAMISDSLDGRPFLERPSVLTRRYLMSCEPELEDFDYEVYVIR